MFIPIYFAIDIYENCNYIRKNRVATWGGVETFRKLARVPKNGFAIGRSLYTPN
jgi:hypothetical protein